ncbi:MAG TPA: deoxyribonuclease IV [Streptosporangiaceae bacterium]
MPARAPAPARPAGWRPVGAHVPVAGGLTAGLRYASAVQAEAIQVFVSSPRGWAAAAGDPAQDAALAGQVSRAGLPVFVHAPYLINAGSPDPVLRERSAAALRHSVRRGAAIGARGVVVHTGSATDGDRTAGLARVRQTLLPVLDELRDGDPDLLLEPMAGQGQMLCCAVPDLGPYLDALRWHPRALLCLDICHLFAAGHDLTAPDGPAALLAAVQDAAPGRLRLVHANDSRDGCGSLRDRHEAIGRGTIGAAAFAALLGDPVTAGVPFIAETPGGQRGHAADVAALRRLRDEAGRPGGPAGSASDGPVPGRTGRPDGAGERQSVMPHSAGASPSSS